MKLKITSTLLCLFVLFFAQAQMKVVIMGSSTAYGTGASTYANSWAGRTDAYLNRNTTDGLDTVVYNIASPGYDTYQEMPTGFVPPAGRPAPDESYNVTMALSYNPEVVIINLPSNDISYGYAKSEMINNLRVMYSTISAQGIRCYITTPQPRNDFDMDHRDSLLSLVDSVEQSFGPFALDFWDDLVTTDGQLMIRPEYQAVPSPIHVNDAGHEVLFERIKNAYIFGIGTLALQLTDLRAQRVNNTVLVKWHTEQQDANTSFELQRSSDGRIFQTIYSQNVPEARPSADYAFTDQMPNQGTSFYRVKTTVQNRVSYSQTISVAEQGTELNISKLYMISGGNSLSVQINLKQSQVVNMTVINASGAILSRQQTYINQPVETINIPVDRLAAGPYFLRLVTLDGNSAVQAFTK